MITAVDSETLTIGVAALGLTAAKTADITVDQVTIYAEGDIRFWTSGKAPTATDGIPLLANSERTFSRGEAAQFKAIRMGGVDVKIHVQYLHDPQ